MARLPIAARHILQTNQSVTATRDRNDIGLPAGPFVKCPPERRDVDVNVAIFHCEAGPHPFQQAILGDDIAFCCAQFAKDVQRPAPELEPNSVTRQLAPFEIKQESAEADLLTIHRLQPYSRRFRTIKLLNQGPYAAPAVSSRERAASAAIKNQVPQMQEMIMSVLLTDETTAELPWTLTFSLSTARKLFEAVKMMITALVANRALRKAEAELMALDDRMLKDIGLDRSEIGSVLMQRWQNHVSGE